MAIYKYQPMDLDGPSIRLLQLFRGNFTDDIQCDLFEGWLEGGIPYEALSYTWGSTETPANIIVNGSIMLVTLNLFEALQQLRLEDEDRILWIDAICIDQKNYLERGHQVQQMSRIYKEAERVIIWLGQGTEETDLIMDSMKRLHETNVKVEGDWRRSAPLYMNHWPDIQSSRGDIDVNENTWRRQGMESILERPWFRRIWILQEVANARVATILCGKKSVSAGTFAQVPPILELRPDPHCQAVLDIMPGLSRKESWWKDNRDLYTLLVKFRGSEATDKRDMIYALLGISSDAYSSDFLLPDYTKSLQQVIQDTTSFLLSHRNLDSLYRYLDWTLPEFLQNLESLNSAALGNASKNGHEALVKLLLRTGRVELDWTDKNNRTALWWATQNGHEIIVKQLLKAGANMEAKDKNRLEVIVKQLLEAGANIELNDGDDRSPLSWAAQIGHEVIVKQQLEAGTNMEANDKNGWTPLSWAAQNGHEAIVKQLLKAGANMEADDKSGWTPLSWAAQNGHEVIVKRLLEAGAEKEAKDKNGRTPLWWAARRWHAVIVKQLLEAGANIEVEDENDRTPLWWAACNGQESVVKQLLEAGANKEANDKDGWTPLSLATQNGHDVVVKQLLKAGADRQVKDIDNRTPLWWAAHNGYKKIVKLLNSRT